MKKIINKLIKNKVLLGIIIGMSLTSTVVYAAYIEASEISFTSQTGLTSANLQAAIDEINDKANTWIDPSYIDFTTLATNTEKTVLASSAGVCIKRNNKVSCMKKGNWNVEKNHIKQIFSDISCSEDSSYVECHASDFYCGVNSDGLVGCYDESDHSNCLVDSDGSVTCY